MPTIRFWKLQSTANHFPLVHFDDVAGIAHTYGRDPEALISQLAIWMCDRHFGVGGDGLLAMKPGAPISHRMFNPDGTEDFCGNGLRCGAVHAVQQGWGSQQFELFHLDRVVPITVSGNEVTAILGRASYMPSEVPLRQGEPELFNRTVFESDSIVLQGSTLSTGSTHTVIPVASLPEDEEFLTISPQIEHFGLFPERTSIMWCETVAVDHLKIRIWERGVGETYGCGTGSSAAAVDYLRRQGRGGKVRIDNPGGTVNVELENWSAPIKTTGIATELFRGDFRLPLV